MSVVRWAAPLGYAVAGIVLVDQVAFLLAQGPLSPEGEGRAFRFALFFANRAAAVVLGLTVLAGAALVMRHRFGMGLAAILALALAVVAGLTLPVAITTIEYPDLATISATQSSGTGPLRVRITTALVASILAFLALSCAVLVPLRGSRGGC